ncbi:glutamine-synthetase adenylyltransferase [Aquimixticola soesokkakensis]|nr:glutamine-synthetase adenylyltransferase [Aquimixticola soesokkakensis]
MDTASRLTRLPRPFDPDRGADARALTPDLTGPLSDLVAGAAGCAPYLAGLIAREAAWIVPALQAPEAALDAELTRISQLEGDAVSAGLRSAKRRIALLAGLCDLGGVWSLEAVTRALTRLADQATHTALTTRVAHEIRRGKIPGAHADDAATAGGMTAMAMGKMGAFELNYSSDIDLICLFDESRFERGDQMDARAGFIRATRAAMALLSDLTEGGYVFRTDLRLRPDPSVTPVCFAMEAAERYYESVGRTWERAAFIKARACAGDMQAGAQFLERLTPFVWRKHLDFAAIDDTFDMRRKIRDHKGLGGPLQLEGHNMKLGAGGIREIEFFTQTRQLVAGGRDPSLRARATVDGLAALAHKNWITQDVAQSLTRDYRAHREVEHRLQMLRDAQTHCLPTAPEDFARLAAFMDTDVASLRRDILERVERVGALTEDYFAPTAPAPAPQLPAEMKVITDRWTSYPCLRSERARAIFDRLKPDLYRRLQALDAPLDALTHLDGFLKGLPSGVQLFALFEANPPLVDLILDIAGTAPHLARYLSRNADVLDAVIGGSFFEPWPDLATLTGDLGRALARCDDYEAKLDMTRRWAREWHFRTGVHQLRGLIDADQAGRQYADLARACVDGIFPVVRDMFAAKHGAPPGNGAMVLGMGSLGAGRLTAASDLDMIVIYDAEGIEASDGKRPLPTRSYYARFTQALITALTVPMAEGKLYEVDMRLRPSGKQGPVATSLAAFERYQREEAWTWEHLALTRATPVAGAPALRAAVEERRRAILNAKGAPAMTRTDTATMRARLASAKPAHSVWDPKNGAGRLMDIELTAEACALMAHSPQSCVYAQLEAGVDIGWLTRAQADQLGEAYRLMWTLQSSARLLSGERFDPDLVGVQGRDFVARAAGVTSIDALAARIATATTQTGALIAQLLPPPPDAPPDTAPDTPPDTSPDVPPR